MPCCSTASSTASELRSWRLKRFWTEAIGVSVCAACSWSTETLESPISRIFPSSFNLTSSPTDSSNGTLGSGRWNW